MEGQAKRAQVFQAEAELLQSAELALKEQLATERELRLGLESEKAKLATKLDRSSEDHASFVQQMDSKLRDVVVRRFLFSFPFETR